MSELVGIGLVMSFVAAWRQPVALGFGFLRVAAFWTVIMLLAAFEEEVLRSSFHLALANAEIGLVLLGVFGWKQAPREPDGVGISPAN
ncbi:hypothetical protein ABS71_07825 [bacterium SCN 62-11]|nr:hypothetical protein [Candidatus Eremiobacteraeota bacterium]ODT72255.1 MAG: hypothetical protein ABS71_07825 [bacterium SCN 62-11]